MGVHFMQHISAADKDAEYQWAQRGWQDWKDADCAAFREVSGAEAWYSSSDRIGEPADRGWRLFKPRNLKF